MKMPPKQAAAPPVQQQKPKDFTLVCTFRNISYVRAPSPRESTDTPAPPLTEGWRMRLCSEWSSCSLTTPIIGDRSMPWVNSEDESHQHISFSFDFSCDLSTEEQLGKFIRSPFIYVFVFHVNTESLQPASFFAIDCSNAILEQSTTQICRNVTEGVTVSLSVTNERPLVDANRAIPLEPLRLRFKGLTSFPIYQNEGENEAIDGTYMYGRLRMGGLDRDVLVFPSNAAIDFLGTKSSPSVKHPISQSVVVLPGLGSIPRFHDALASSTFAVEVHQDDLLDRCFAGGHHAEYCKMVSGEPGGLALPVPAVAPPQATAPAPTKKGAAATKAPVAAEPVAFVPSPSSPTPSDLFIIRRLTEELHRSCLIRNHGAARFRLEQLLQQSNDLLTKFRRRRGESSANDHVVVSEELMLEVRLEKPSHPEKWSLPSDLSLKQALSHAKSVRGKVEKPRVIKKPPRYELFLTNGTYLSMTAELHRHLHQDAHQIDSASPFPLQLTLSSSTKEQRHEARNLTDESLAEILRETPFTRMVIAMRYDNDEALESFNRGVNEINGRPLPNIQGTVRSYSLTEEEVENAKRGSLDVLSGFMVIDDDIRIIVIEGLAAPDCAMEAMYLDYLPKLKDNDDSLSILVNPEVLFPERLYPTYSPDVKRIRVRGKLKKLARRPEIYNRMQVEDICFKAVDSLMALKRAEDLKTSKQLDIFPSSEALNKLELLYGEAITRSDMDGTLKREFVQNATDHRSRKEARSPSGLGGDASPSGTGAKTKRERKEFQFTDCRNPDFELHLQTRPQHRIDYLAEQRELRKQAWLNMLHRRETRQKELTKTIKSVLGLMESEKTGRRRAGSAASVSDEEKADDQPLPRVYLYAGQSENFKEKAWNQLRDKIANDHNATYTFSKDFMSQNISAVDESREKKKEAEREKSSWLTSKGFQYPKPKTIKELLTHPKRPSNARIEELREPFFDATDKAANEDEISKSPDTIQKEKGFRTQVNGTALFGALELPAFEHEFQLKYVGDRQNLPRGRLLNDSVPDPNFFRSVHLGGENQARIVEEALQKEKEEWRSRVVVDDIAFKVGKMNVRDKPIQSEKCADILHDEAKRKELIYLRERRSHRNTSFAHTTAPLSILNTEPYAPNAGQKLLARVPDATKFITARLDTNDPFSGMEGSASQKPADFVRFIHEGTNKSKIVTMIAKRKHPTQDPSEKHGAKWDAA